MARGQGLRSMSEDQVLRPKLSVSVSGLPPSINTNWVAGKIKALGFSPLKVTNNSWQHIWTPNQHIPG
ncbi:hypothetical protein ACLKA6_012797 [Drosophila palustris]